MKKQPFTKNNELIINWYATNTNKTKEIEVSISKVQRLDSYTAP
jgi:hypothetical protein